MAANAKAMFEQKVAEANPDPGYVDNGPNFKPGWKSTGNSGGFSREGTFQKKKRVEFSKPPPQKKSLADLP